MADEGSGSSQVGLLHGGGGPGTAVAATPSINRGGHGVTRPVLGREGSTLGLPTGVEVAVRATTPWDFPGWGTTVTTKLVKVRGGELAALDDVVSGKVDPLAQPPPPKRHAALDQYRATAIAGNDLLSSCLYTAGLCAQYSGKMAPISLSLVSFMLYFFRHVYSEVVTAMPVNGGSYNALLNTTSKRFAALAACLSLISYVATAVVSGCDAMLYAQSVAPGLNVPASTIAVLGFFALLTLLGVGESAAVATFMFILHVFTLVILVIWSLVYACRDGWSIFVNNWRQDYFPAIPPATGSVVAVGTAGTAIFFGYAAALLGITGFETAANYVEEMADAKTYVQTLRNMWWAAALFNPLISLGAMAVLDMQSELLQHPSDLLSAMAVKMGGYPLQLFVAIDATLVLAGSVLTAYVGVTGLVQRMAMDRCLPSVLMSTNKWRGTPHWVIIGFFVLTSTLFLLLWMPASDKQTSVNNLGGVYDIAFLSVMSAFAISCIILKWKRPDLPRMVVAGWTTILVALAFVLAGLVGNIIMNRGILAYFALYFGIAVGAVFLMFNRTPLFRFAYRVFRGCMASSRQRKRMLEKVIALKKAHKRTEMRWLASRHAEAGAALATSPDVGDAIGLPAMSDAALRAAMSVSLPTGAPLTASGGAGITASINGLAASLSSPLRRSSEGEEVSLHHPLTASAKHDSVGLALSPYHPLKGEEEATKRAGQGDGDERTPPPTAAVATVAVLDEEDEEDEGDDESTGRAGTMASLVEGEEFRWQWQRSVFTWLQNKIKAINEEPVVYFAKDGYLATLNKAVQYVKNNELSARLWVVHVVDDRKAVAALRAEQVAAAAAAATATAAAGARDANRATLPSSFASKAVATSDGNGGSGDLLTSSSMHAPVHGDDASSLSALLDRLPPPSPAVQQVVESCGLLDSMYPKLRIDCMIVRGSYFSPAVVRFIARHLQVVPNMMFMAMPDVRFQHQFAALGGVRVITSPATAQERQEGENQLRQVLRSAAERLVVAEGDAPAPSGDGGEGLRRRPVGNGAGGVTVWS